MAKVTYVQPKDVPLPKTYDGMGTDTTCNGQATPINMGKSSTARGGGAAVKGLGFNKDG